MTFDLPNYTAAPLQSDLDFGPEPKIYTNQYGNYFFFFISGATAPPHILNFGPGGNAHCLTEVVPLLLRSIRIGVHGKEETTYLQNQLASQEGVCSME